MQDVVTLPVTLSERRSARNRQEAYLAFSLYAIKRIGVALNQVTIVTPTRYTQFESWILSRVVFAHAHEITDAAAREVSSCCFRVSKRFEKVWPSLRQTKARKNHVFAFLPLSLGSFISGVADSDSLPANMETNSQKKG